jgi:GDP-L-fucose synthase
LLTGSSGMLGSSIYKSLIQQKPKSKVFAPSSLDLNLLDSKLVEEKIAEFKPDQIIHCAARVGGIQANIEDPISYFFPNVRMDTNVISAATSQKVNSLIYFGSSCMYPTDSEQPILESQLLTGTLEPTNEGYALSKILATKLISAMALQFSLDWHVFILSNLYGPGDKYSRENSHLIAAIINKIDLAVQSGSKQIDMWGDGSAKREFTYVGDVANFVVGKLGETHSMPAIMNLGAGEDFTVMNYYENISKIMGFSGAIIPLTDKPVGMKRKLMNSNLANSYGWNPKTDLESGLTETILRYQSGRKAFDDRK